MQVAQAARCLSGLGGGTLIALSGARAQRTLFLVLTGIRVVIRRSAIAEVNHFPRRCRQDKPWTIFSTSFSHFLDMNMTLLFLSSTSFSPFFPPYLFISSLFSILFLLFFLFFLFLLFTFLVFRIKFQFHILFIFSCFFWFFVYPLTFIYFAL